MTASLADTAEVPVVRGPVAARVMPSVFGSVGAEAGALLPPRTLGTRRDAMRARRLALRQERRQRYLIACGGIAILVLFLVATVLVIGVVR